MPFDHLELFLISDTDNCDKTGSVRLVFGVVSLEIGLSLGARARANLPRVTCLRLEREGRIDLGEREGRDCFRRA